jgi:hypothetical protein
MAQLMVGVPIWLKCEVRPGPFPDERLVRVKANGSDWVGFVPAMHLDNPVEEGQTKVRARVVGLESGSFTAKVLGHSISPQPIHGLVDEVERVDPVQAGHHPLH